MEYFNLKILTPDNIIYDAPVKRIVCSDKTGQFTILKKHENTIRSLVRDKILIEDNNKTEIIFKSSSGVIEVFNSEVTICVTEIEKDI